jgi:hypothetical protein
VIDDDGYWRMRFWISHFEFAVCDLEVECLESLVMWPLRCFAFMAL